MGPGLSVEFLLGPMANCWTEEKLLETYERLGSLPLLHSLPYPLAPLRILISG